MAVSAMPAGAASRPTLMTPHDGAPRWTRRGDHNGRRPERQGNSPYVNISRMRLERRACPCRPSNLADLPQLICRYETESQRASVETMNSAHVRARPSAWEMSAHQAFARRIGQGLKTIPDHKEVRNARPLCSACCRCAHSDGGVEWAAYSRHRGDLPNVRQCGIESRRYVQRD